MRRQRIGYAVAGVGCVALLFLGAAFLALIIAAAAVVASPPVAAGLAILGTVQLVVGLSLLAAVVLLLLLWQSAPIRGARARTASVPARLLSYWMALRRDLAKALASWTGPAHTASSAAPRPVTRARPDDAAPVLDT